MVEMLIRIWKRCHIGDLKGRTRAGHSASRIRDIRRRYVKCRHLGFGSPLNDRSCKRAGAAAGIEYMSIVRKFREIQKPRGQETAETAHLKFIAITARCREVSRFSVYGQILGLPAIDSSYRYTLLHCDTGLVRLSV